MRIIYVEVSKNVNVSGEKSIREPLKVNTENNTSTDALLKPPQNNKRSFEGIICSNFSFVFEIILTF